MFLARFYDVAIYGELGGDAWEQVNERLEELPGATFLFLTAFLGFVLAPPTALLVPGGRGSPPRWPAVAVAIGEVAGQSVHGGVGLLLLAAPPSPSPTRSRGWRGRAARDIALLEPKEL